MERSRTAFFTQLELNPSPTRDKHLRMPIPIAPGIYLTVEKPFCKISWRMAKSLSATLRMPFCQEILILSMSTFGSGVATDKEDVVFENLVAVVEAIVNEVQKSTQRNATLKMISKPSVAPQSGRHNSARPDAYLLMDGVNRRSATLRSSSDKGASEIGQRDNDQNIIWSLHHIMRNDPCRRATFGITIENVNIRVWFTCRSMTLVSESFNFITNVEDTIHLFGCLAFAEDHELGWDTSIRRVLYEGTIQYLISINGIVYRTVGIISDFGAEAMRGRVIIKDTSRDSDRMPEDEILHDILADKKKFCEDAAAIAAKQHFLTVLDQDDVKIRGVADDTQHLLHGKDLPDPLLWYKVSPDHEPTLLPHTFSVGNVPLPPARPINQRLGSQKIRHKRHSRLVFDEIGQPIYTLDTLHDVAKTLDGAVRALGYMHRAGWDHRDISSVNVLRHEDRGLITDLEYAKRRTSSEYDEVRTGTADFMACEIESQEYLFCPTTPIPGWVLRPAPLSKSSPVVTNPLRDLESSWWILIWVLH
ncbi:hypothetical protein BU15DRAFT_70959 [Melanogaster broomeanus]|nr:hypothetical protein BU15DRAFT_70959 [Melanogaster broomeanus]